MIADEVKSNIILSDGDDSEHCFYSMHILYSSNIICIINYYIVFFLLLFFILMDLYARWAQNKYNDPKRSEL